MESDDRYQDTQYECDTACLCQYDTNRRGQSLIDWLPPIDAEDTLHWLGYIRNTEPEPDGANTIALYFLFENHGGYEAVITTGSKSRMPDEKVLADMREQYINISSVRSRTFPDRSYVRYSFKSLDAGEIKGLINLFALKTQYENRCADDPYENNAKLRILSNSLGLPTIMSSHSYSASG